MKMRDLTGERFGKLIVISDSGNRTSCGGIIWNCVCDCGNRTKVRSKNLLSGNTKSCGCGKRNLKHGMSKSRLYVIWSGMKERCNNSLAHNYMAYGGRGITVCEEWKSNFEEFQKWAFANGYREDLTIDRINNDNGYCPDNCRWISTEEQQRNRRNNRTFIINGEKKTLAEVSEKLGFSSSTSITARVKRGWSIEDAISKKPRKYRKVGA